MKDTEDISVNLSGTASGVAWVKPRFWWIVVLVGFCMVAGEIPGFRLVLAPITIFVTTIHELGHALACLATGGAVSGLTIVSDSHGHGGLTFCQGGNPFIYTPAGYLGTALAGCLLVAAARLPRLSKSVLFFIGCVIGLASVVLMSGTIFQQGRIFEGIGSIFWGLLLAAGLIWAALKLPVGLANFLLLFLAVETGLNALSDVILLAEQSMGLSPGAWSDATNMAQLTGIPAFIWAILWAITAGVMLGWTLMWTFRSEAHGKRG